MYLSSTFADPKTNNELLLLRDHCVNWAKKYETTILKRACKFCKAKFSRVSPPWHRNFGTKPHAVLKIVKTAFTTMSILHETIQIST
uniref:Uncharacterized protein n=1 Tax=Romanomermis culicivorax TaxID=13658 RepID=A0A915HE88_ROMCU